MAAGSDPHIVVRVGGADDDAAVADLLSRGAPGNPKADLEVLRWQYRTEAFGPTTTVVAELDGQVVGHYSAISVPLVIDGHHVKAVRGVDIVTDPEHRGQGVFARVAEHLVEVLRNDGVEVVVSTPNDDSLPALAGRGWNPAGDPWVYALPVDGKALSHRSPVSMPPALGRAGVAAFGFARRGWMAVDRSPAGEITTVVDTDLPDGLESLLGAASGPESPTGIIRSERWLCWRYLDHPRRPYRFVGARRGDELTGIAVVSTRDDDDGRYTQILELLVTDRSCIRALVDAVVEEARVEGAAAVVGAALIHTDHARALRRGGLVRVPRRLQPRPIHLLVGDLSGSRPNLAFRPWSFTLGDQDHL